MRCPLILEDRKVLVEQQIPADLFDFLWVPIVFNPQHLQNNCWN
jgi:hypothetical protein